MSSVNQFKSCFYTFNRRKNVGVLATKRWKNKFPKFNTPQLKAELKEFAREISSECSLPAAGFLTEGIEEHIKHFFNEQRRAHKKKEKVQFIYHTH